MKYFSYWNSSLFIRLAVLVVLTVGASQAFTIWLFSRENQNEVSKNQHAQIKKIITDLGDTLASMPAKGRADFIKKHNRLSGDNMQILPITSTQKTVLVPQTSKEKKALYSRHHKSKKHDLWIKTKLVDTEYWLVVPQTHFEPRSSATLLNASFLASLLAMFLAFFIAWRVTRPLSLLASAVQLLQQGISPSFIKPSGPSEIAIFIKQFNRMVSALEHSLSERRLMLAGLSHDLRTPLTRLQLGLVLQPENPEREGMLDDVDQMSRIVQQFIDFARSEEAMNFESLQLAELADNVVARFVREGVDVSLQKWAEPELNADALALERMLSNLIDNARHYGKEPIIVRVKEDQQNAIVCVLDAGNGIEKSQREDAFEPFERLASYRGSDGGSGLGLAIVSRVVKQHQGQLEFIDPPGGGFGIKIILPKINANLLIKKAEQPLGGN